jgi:hypothetical protein
MPFNQLFFENIVIPCGILNCIFSETLKLAISGKKYTF